MIKHEIAKTVTGLEGLGRKIADGAVHLGRLAIGAVLMLVATDAAIDFLDSESDDKAGGVGDEVHED